MVSLRFGGVRFVVYVNDHPPRHVHGFAGETRAIVDLHMDGSVTLASRDNAMRPLHAKKSDVRKILWAAAEHFEELPRYGRRSMEKSKHVRHKVRFADADFRRAIEAAKRFPEEPVATGVEYRPGPGLDLVILKLSDGSRRAIPREDLQGLESGTAEQLSRIEIIGGGTGLHWPELDADFYVPGILRGIHGNKAWMAKIGRRGGSVRSAAKKAASRANGRLGGRPRKAATGTGV